MNQSSKEKARSFTRKTFEDAVLEAIVDYGLSTQKEQAGKLELNIKKYRSLLRKYDILDLAREFSNDVAAIPFYSQEQFESLAWNAVVHKKLKTQQERADALNISLRNYRNKLKKYEICELEQDLARTVWRERIVEKVADASLSYSEALESLGLNPHPKVGARRGLYDLCLNNGLKPDFIEHRGRNAKKNKLYQTIGTLLYQIAEKN